MEDAIQLTHEEIERLRQIVLQHNKQSVVNEFDLNNPKTKPYRHQDFPRLVYFHDNRTHKLVKNEEQLAEALKAGWRIEPYPNEPEPEPLLEADAAEEAAKNDAQARKPKPKQK